MELRSISGSRAETECDNERDYDSHLRLLEAIRFRSECLFHPQYQLVPFGPMLNAKLVIAIRIEVASAILNC
jgi:hypothetical protein